MENRVKKVVPGSIVTHIDDIDTTIEVTFHRPIDESLYSLYQSLEAKADASRADCLDTLGQTLIKARRSLSGGDRLVLDKLAQDLSLNALKIGASQLLSSAIEMQSLARIGAFEAAAELLGRMEFELVEVKQHYA